MLGEDDALLVGRQLRELSAASQRIKHRPLPLRVEHRPPRPLQQDVGEIGLVPERVCAAEHRVLRLLHERRERLRVQHRPHAIEEERRLFTERQQADAARIVDVFVDDARQAGSLDRLRKRARVGRAAECQKLHEQPLIEPLRLALFHAALFEDVRRLRSAPRRRLCHSRQV